MIPLAPEGSDRHLAVLRIAAFGLWFGLIATTDTVLYAQFPSTMLDPRGLAHLLPLETLFGSPALLLGLKVAALVTCALAAFGTRPYPLWAGAAAVLVIVHDTLMKSLGGYANHAQAASLLILVVLAMFPAADALTIGGRSPKHPATSWMYRAPVLAVGALLTLTYSFIGARRLFIGGVGIYTDDSLLRWMVGRTLEYGAHDFDLTGLVLANRWVIPLLTVGMFVVTIFEVLSPLALRFPRFRRVWLVMIIGFHFFTLFTMNIFFWENIILLVLLFTPLAQRLVRPPAPTERSAIPDSV